MMNRMMFRVRALADEDPPAGIYRTAYIRSTFCRLPIMSSKPKSDVKVLKGQEGIFSIIPIKSATCVDSGR